MLEDFSTNEMTNVWILIIPIRLFMKALQWLLHWWHIIFFFKFPNQKAPFLLFGEKNHILILFVHFFEKIVKAKLRPEGSLDHFIIYILQALECFTLYSKAFFFLHYMLLFFNFWVKIRPMFVKIWFRININWHYLAKSAKKKSCYLRLYRTMLCVVPLLNAYYMAVPLN